MALFFLLVLLPSRSAILCEWSSSTAEEVNYTREARRGKSIRSARSASVACDCDASSSPALYQNGSNSGRNRRWSPSSKFAIPGQWKGGEREGEKKAEFNQILGEVFPPKEKKNLSLGAVVGQSTHQVYGPLQQCRTLVSILLREF